MLPTDTHTDTDVHVHPLAYRTWDDIVLPCPVSGHDSQASAAAGGRRYNQFDPWRKSENDFEMRTRRTSSSCHIERERGSGRVTSAASVGPVLRQWRTPRPNNAQKKATATSAASPAAVALNHHRADNSTGLPKVGITHRAYHEIVDDDDAPKWSHDNDSPRRDGYGRGYRV